MIETSPTPQQSRREPRWHCPRCLVSCLPGLLAVRWCEGLADLGPAWMCSSCLAELYQAASDPAGRLDLENLWRVSTIDLRPYAITIEATKGEPGEARPHQQQAAKPHRPWRAPRRGGVAV